MHDIGCWRVLDRVFWFVGVRSCFLPECAECEPDIGFWATLVSNNCEGTDAMARDVVDGSKGVVGGLGQDNATCLSGAV